MMTNRFFIYKWIIKNNWGKKKKRHFQWFSCGENGRTEYIQGQNTTVKTSRRPLSNSPLTQGAACTTQCGFAAARG